MSKTTKNTPTIRRREVFTGVKDAARRFGVSEAYVSKMLHGHRRGNKRMRSMLADLAIAEGK